MPQTLKSVFSAHQGKVSDKWASYLDIYDYLFQNMRTNEVSFLEIGVQNGGSMEIWAHYFEKAKHIVGCDINPDCKTLKFSDDRISIVIGAATSPETCIEIQKIAPSYDIILDDGSHTSTDIITTFHHLFPLVAEHGFYIIEDLHCSYFSTHEGNLNGPNTSMAFLRRLSDYPNRQFWKNSDLTVPVAGFAQHYGLDFSKTGLENIHSVQFFNSICIIKKAPLAEQDIGPRVVRGIDASLVASVASLDQTEFPVRKIK